MSSTSCLLRWMKAFLWAAPVTQTYTSPLSGKTTASFQTSYLIIVILAFVIWAIKVQDTIRWLRVAQCWVFCHHTHVCICMCAHTQLSCVPPHHSCVSKGGPHSKHISWKMYVPWHCAMISSSHVLFNTLLLKTDFPCQPRDDLNLAKSKEIQWCVPDSWRLSFESLKLQQISAMKCQMPQNHGIYPLWFCPTSLRYSVPWC